jgi:hypothetical protein
MWKVVANDSAFLGQYAHRPKTVRSLKYMAPKGSPILVLFLTVSACCSTISCAHRAAVNPAGTYRFSDPSEVVLRLDRNGVYEERNEADSKVERGTWSQDQRTGVILLTPPFVVRLYPFEVERLRADEREPSRLQWLPLTPRPWKPGSPRYSVLVRQEAE